MEQRNVLLDMAETCRREPRGFETDNRSPGPPDMGASLSDILTAVHHLRESLPNGQRVRTVAAAAALHRATSDLVRWLEGRGVHMDSARAALLEAQLLEEMLLSTETKGENS